MRETFWRHARRTAALIVGMLPLVSGCGDSGGERTSGTRAAAPEGLHSAILTLDSHVDIPFDFATANVDPLTAPLQVNLDKMRLGGLDAAFFIVYVGQRERTDEGYADALRGAITKFEAIRRMTEQLYPQAIGLAFSADDVERLAAEGRLAAAIGIENGFVIGRDLELLDRYYELGGRYMTLVHNGHNDLADSAQPSSALGNGETEHGGVSVFGEQVIARMNDLGMMVDISHASKQSALDAMRLSRAPVIASHSSVRAVADHPRNLDDETLLALRDNGGVVQIVAYAAFLRPLSTVDTESLPPPTVEDLVDHIDYAVRLIGLDHVGIASDFGGGGGVIGWADAAETPAVTAALAARGYGEREIAQLWSGNLLRVWREAERAARR